MTNSEKNKDFDLPPEVDFPIGMYEGKISIVTPEEHRRGAMERNAYENETEEQDIEGAEADEISDEELEKQIEALGIDEDVDYHTKVPDLE